MSRLWIAYHLEGDNVTPHYHVGETCKPALCGDDNSTHTGFGSEQPAKVLGTLNALGRLTPKVVICRECVRLVGLLRDAVTQLGELA